MTGINQIFAALTSVILRKSITLTILPQSTPWRAGKFVYDACVGEKPPRAFPPRTRSTFFRQRSSADLSAECAASNASHHGSGLSGLMVTTSPFNYHGFAEQFARFLLTVTRGLPAVCAATSHFLGIVCFCWFFFGVVLVRSFDPVQSINWAGSLEQRLRWFIGI